MVGRFFAKATLLVVLVGWVGGCGDSGQNGSSTTKPDGKLVTVTRGELSEVKLGPYFPSDDPQIPGLDDNRVKVAGPKGWQVGSNPGKAKLLVWFKQSAQYDYPQILVTAEDFEQIMNVSKETVSKFAHLLASSLRKKNLDVEVVPIRVGDRYGAMYRRLGRAKRDFTEIDLESLIVETVVDGRKYAFELRTYPGHVEKYLHELYAVFLMAKFLKGGEPSEQPPPETPRQEPPPEQPPAKPETPSEKPKTQPGPSEPPAKPAPPEKTTKPEPPPEKPQPKQPSPPEPKQPPETKPPEGKPQPKPEPPEKPKKKKPIDFEIVE